MQTDIHSTPEHANLFDTNIEDSSMNERTLPIKAYQTARSIVIPNNQKDASRAVLVSMGLLFLAMVMALIAFFSVANAAYAGSPAKSSSIGTTLYLPMINAGSNTALRTSENDDTEVDDSETACALEESAERLAKLMINAPEQGREELTCNPLLATVAQIMAQDMAERAYFSDVNPDGIGPNQLIVNAGYALPDFYGSDADSNNVASIGAGYATAEAMWASQSNSSQLLGTREFYAAQTDYGIGHYYDPDSEYGHYWVVITATH